MDTRAFSMARNLRFSASVSAFVIIAACGPVFAQNRGDDQITVPFSSLSAAAQQEIISLQRGLNRETASDPLLFPLDAPVARRAPVPLQAETVMLDGRKVRVNWAIGVYR
jgi:hypothetical protein